MLLLPETLLHGAVWVDDLTNAPVRLVDWTFTGKDKQIVYDTAKEAADHWCDHWDPEVVAASGPYICPVADTVCPESWTEITSHVDGEAGLPAEASSDAELSGVSVD